MRTFFHYSHSYNHLEIDLGRITDILAGVQIYSDAVNKNWSIKAVSQCRLNSEDHRTDEGN